MNAGARRPCAAGDRGHQRLFPLTRASIFACMRFAEDNTAGNVIRACGADRITVNDEVITRSVVVTPERILRDWLPAAFAELEAGHLTQLDELQPEIVVIGTGPSLRFPAPEFTAGFLVRGIGVEIMDTAAACRTYNILLSEGRRVVAALLLAD